MSDLQSGFILHHYAYKDTSVLLKILTEKDGLVTAIARGAKRMKSPLHGISRSFIPLSLSVVGRGEVKSIKNMEAMEMAYDFTSEQLISALYLNEISLHFLNQHPEAGVELFGVYQQALVMLDNKNIEPALRLFELKLLDVLGYGIELTHDIDSNFIETDKFYTLIPGQLPVKLSIAPKNRMVKYFSGADLQAISKRDFTNKSTLQAAKHLLRDWVGFYLNGKRLKSKELWLAV